MACVLCECVIHSNQHQRLRAESTRNVLCVLLEYCNDQPQLLQQPGLFVCCLCVRLVESTQKIKQKEVKIKHYIKKLIQKYERCIDSDNIEGEEFSEELEVSTCTVQKCTASAAELLRTPNRLRKTLRYETPTKEMLNRMHPVGSSPVVAVRYLYEQQSFHWSFLKFQCNMMLHNLSLENSNEWMTQQLERLITYGCIKKNKFNVQWKCVLNN